MLRVHFKNRKSLMEVTAPENEKKLFLFRRFQELSVGVDTDPEFVVSL